MNRNGLFGVACKTCRRRGRKCDRRLPKCINCSLRGAECEGYTLRWVKVAVGRHHLEDQTMTTFEDETNVNVTPISPPLSSAKTFKATKMVNPVQRRTKKKLASRTEFQIPDLVTRPERHDSQTTSSRGLRVQQQQPPIESLYTLMAHDGLEDLVRYCASISRRPVSKSPLIILQMSGTSVHPSILATVRSTHLAATISYL